MNEDTIKELTGTVAVQCKLASLEGFSFVKKKKRFNHMVSYILHTRAMGGDLNIFDRDYMGEVVLMATDDETTATGYDSIQEAIEHEHWMADQRRKV